MEEGRGLANSRWASVSSHHSRQPYYFNRRTYSASNSISASVTATVKTSQTEETFASSTNPSIHNGNVLASRSNGATTTAQNTQDVSYQSDIASALQRIPTPGAELERVMKIVRRIKWKFPFLAHGYNAATTACAPAEQREEAELMFKLDFFEYYMLLERALVHLLGVFGIKVTGAFGSSRVPDNHQQSNHRFHANVLEALADVRNPLHEALGQGDAALALLRAKELRNRWKNADDPNSVQLPSAARANRPLKDYDLEWILETIFAGFDRGFQVAERYVNEVRAAAIERGVTSGADEQAEEWEFMTDAMDWQAV